MMNWTEVLTEVYSLSKGDLYFLSIDSEGELLINLGGAKRRIRDIVPSGSATLRLPQLITAQIKKSMDAFHKVAKRYNFNSKFKPLYPIKVNQRKLEVSTVVNSSHIFGLESGTKSEFIICQKMFRGQEGRIIMSNGVKDTEYFELMRDALLNGHRVLISIEGINELKMALKIIPRDKLELYLRIKPYSTISGKWGSSSGRNSKFGLNIYEVYEVLEILHNEEATDHLIGIHAHPGSQITNFDELVVYAEFLSHIFKEINNRGFSMKNIDFGGGLPINYDGWSPGNLFESYYESIFKGMSLVFENDYPNILTESGRAITALSSLVVVEILDIYSSKPQDTDEDDVTDFPSVPREEAENSNSLLKKVQEGRKIIEFWRNLPNNREYSLQSILESEELLQSQKMQLRKKFFRTMYHGLIKEAYSLISPDYILLGNFSVFNAACDHVLVNQYFPIIPTHGLAEQPATFARLVDITCDSDGEISNFCPPSLNSNIFTKDGYPLSSETYCEIPGFPIPHPYLLKSVVIPLLGAYQDIIQFDHNLIGDLPDILVHEENGSIKSSTMSEAQNITDILKKVGYSVDSLQYPYIFNEREHKE